MTSNRDIAGDLRTLLAIAREGTLAGAARRLKVNHSTVFRRLGAIEARLGTRLWLSASCSLLHVPHDLAQESRLDPRIRNWMAFAHQKLDELAVLRRALDDGEAAVWQALQANVAAATILPSRTHRERNSQLRIAFDGDAVLFADDSERVYQTEGLAAFAASEKKMASTPMTGGPFRKFLQSLHQLQSKWPRNEAPIRTALFTARSAPAHERVIRTLRAWNIRIDEAAFLGGLDKGEFLQTFGADIFFDDQTGHCESARRYVPTGHVPHGVTNDAA